MTRRTPEQYDWDKVEFDETIVPASPQRFTSPRREKIQFVVIHHMAMVGQGDGSANDACLRAWKTREASAGYGVDGRFVRQFVWDSDAAWATANSHGNHAGISIEHANSTGKPSWKVSDETIATGAKLVAYLHKVYKLGRPVLGKTLFQHSDFFATACAGPYLGGSHLDEYEAEAQRVYDEITGAEPVPTPEPPEDPMFEYPAQVLGKHFQKATLPIDGPDSGTWADEITPPRWLTYTSEWLRVASDGTSVMFTCFHGGATTSGSENPRTEARETWTDGSLAKWDGRKGKHSLKAILSVNLLTPVKPQVVLEQIHNGDDDVATIRAVGVKDSAGKLTERIKLYGTNGNDSKYAYLGEVKRTQKFTVALEVANGRISFVLNGKKHSKTVAATANSYFKLGLYLQSNPSSDSAPTEVRGRRSVVRLFAEPEVKHAA